VLNQAHINGVSTSASSATSEDEDVIHVASAVPLQKKPVSRPGMTGPQDDSSSVALSAPLQKITKPRSFPTSTSTSDVSGSTLSIKSQALIMKTEASRPIIVKSQASPQSHSFPLPEQQHGTQSSTPKVETGMQAKSGIVPRLKSILQLQSQPQSQPQPQPQPQPQSQPKSQPKVQPKAQVQSQSPLTKSVTPSKTTANTKAIIKTITQPDIDDQDELQAAPPSPTSDSNSSSASESDSEASDESEAYEIEAILSHRWSDPRTHNDPTLGNKPVMLYQVKWVGYDEPTWEPRSSFEDDEVLESYYAMVEARKLAKAGAAGKT